MRRWPSNKNHRISRQEGGQTSFLYMDACVCFNSRVSLYVFLDHDKRPFSLRTYFPKNDSPYGAGFMTILNAFPSYGK